MASVAERSTAFVRMTRVHRLSLLAMFAAYFVLAMIARQYDRTPTDDWIPAALALYILSVAAPLFFTRSSVGWFHPIVFSSVMRLIDLLRRFAMYAWGLDWHSALPSSVDQLSDLIAFQLLLSTLATVAYYAGFYLGPKIGVPKLDFPHPRRVVRTMVAVCAVSVIAFAVYIANRGGLATHVASWSSGRHQSLAGDFYQIAIINISTPACWIWLAYRPSSVRSPLFWGAVAVSLAIIFLSTGSRSSVVYPAIIGLMIWMLRERRVMLVRALFAAAAAVYLIAAVGNFRKSGWEGRHDWQAATEDPIMETMANGVEGELTERTTVDDAALPVLALVPDDVPLEYGSTYLAVLTLPVPRALWSEKPGLVDGRVGEVFFGYKVGRPPGALGEAYWNFHIAGVFAVFFLFGIFHAWMARAFIRYRDQTAVIVLYASGLLLLRDPSSSLFVNYLLIVIPLFALLVLVRGIGLGRSRRREVSAVPSAALPPS